MYNIDTAKGQKVYAQCEPRATCMGPNDSMLVWDISGKLLQLNWNNEEEKLKLIKQYDTGNKPDLSSSMFFVKETNFNCVK